MTLAALLRASQADLRRWDVVRERLLRLGRELVRASSARILALHRGERAKDPAFDRRAAEFAALAASAPEFRGAGFVQQPLGEYAEACILEWTLTGRQTVLAGLRKVPGDSILLGIADAIGELRRVVLDRLMRDDLAAAEVAFRHMESLFDLLHHAEAPESLVSLRQKRDAARGLLDRTRGEFVTAKKSKGLEKKIDDVRSLLDEAEGGKKKAVKRADPDDLDLDAAWSKK